MGLGMVKKSKGDKMTTIRLFSIEKVSVFSLLEYFEKQKNVSVFSQL